MIAGFWYGFLRSLLGIIYYLRARKWKRSKIRKNDWIQYDKAEVEAWLDLLRFSSNSSVQLGRTRVFVDNNWLNFSSYLHWLYWSIAESTLPCLIFLNLNLKVIQSQPSAVLNFNEWQLKAWIVTSKDLKVFKSKLTPRTPLPMWERATTIVSDTILRSNVIVIRTVPYISSQILPR